MFDNNDNYSQQFNNQSSNNNSGYPEYYYSQNIPNGNYQQTINAAPVPPAGKTKKKGGFGRKAASVACLGLVFGVTAGAVFSVPAALATKELGETKREIQQMQESLNASAAGKASLSTTADSLNASNALYNNSASANVTAIANNCLPSVVSITNKSVTEVRTMFGTFQQDAQSSGSGIIIGENDTELLIVTNYHVVS